MSTVKNEYLFLIVGGKDDIDNGNVKFVSYKSDKNEIAKYSRRVITKQLSIILDKISEKNSLIKTLILANDFPPLETIGAQRPYGWFRYFKKSGIYPVVVTRYWESNRKLDENYFHKATF